MSTVTFADRGHPTVYQPISSELYRQHYATTNLPIVIDNGTFECRAGWANAAEPTSRRHHTPSPTLTRIGRALTAVPRCCGAAAVRFRPFVGKTKYKKDPDHIRVGHQVSWRRLLTVAHSLPLLLHLSCPGPTDCVRLLPHGCVNAAWCCAAAA